MSLEHQPSSYVRGFWIWSCPRQNFLSHLGEFLEHIQSLTYVCVKYECMKQLGLDKSTAGYTCWGESIVKWIQCEVLDVSLKTHLCKKFSGRQDNIRETIERELIHGFWFQSAIWPAVKIETYSEKNRSMYQIISKHFSAWIVYDSFIY